MNWTRTFHELTSHGDTFDRAALMDAVARDTVYLPSELAARLLPLDARRDSDVAIWTRPVPGADLRAPAR